MKKLLLTEGLLACFFLALLLGIFGKYLLQQRENAVDDIAASKAEDFTEGTLNIYSGQLQEKFSPLDYEYQGEENVLTMCFEKLLIRDEKGVRKNYEVSEKWNEKDDELAEISVHYDADSDISTVTIMINPEAETAQGAKVDADDILFNFYLRCDASSGVVVPFEGVRILGQEEYTYGTTDVRNRKKEINRELEKPSTELKKLLREKIVKKELSQEFQWVKGLYQDEAYEFISNKYDEAKDLFAYYYAYQTKYSSKGKKEEKVFADILSQYDWDYKKLSKVTGKDYEEEAQRLALSLLLQKTGKDTVTGISGIEKKNDTTVVVRCKGQAKEAEKLCDIWMLPLAEYGDSQNFDGVKNFGFKKGTADKIKQESYQKYIGTGMFFSSAIERGRIMLLRNSNYQGKRALLKGITVLRKEYKESKEIVQDLLEKKVDIAMARDSEKLEKLLANRGTGASYSIRRVAIDTSQPENCFLYRTSYVNAPSLPKELTEYQTLFQQMNQIKVND